MFIVFGETTGLKMWEMQGHMTASLTQKAIRCILNDASCLDDVRKDLFPSLPPSEISLNTLIARTN